MSALSIAVTGIVVVFATLLILSEMLGLLSRVLAPKPAVQQKHQASVQQKPQDFQEAEDVAVITAVMRLRGHHGHLRVTRIS